LPLTIENASEKISLGDELVIQRPAKQIDSGADVTIHNETKSTQIVGQHDLSDRQRDVLKAGGLIAWMRGR